MAPPPAPDGGARNPMDLPSAGGEIRVNHEVLKDVHKKLLADYDELDKHSTTGSLKWFQAGDRGLVGAAELGRYPAAEQVVAMTCKNAYNQIGATYSSFLAAYDNLIKALKRSADNHGEAEQASTQSANNVYRGGSPTTSDSSYAG